MSSCPGLRRLVGRDGASVPDVLRARADQNPDETFLIEGEQRWTFGQGLEQSRRFAGFLKRIDLAEPGTRLASFTSKTSSALWPWFGANLLGGVFVALNRPHKGAILLDLLRRAKAKILVAEASAAEALSAVDDLPFEHIVFIDEVPNGFSAGVKNVLTLDEALTSEPEGGIEVAPEALASVVFTSGTTGRSKAVLVPHNYLCRGAARFVEGFQLTSGDVVHDWMPLSHLSGQMHMAMAGLVSGATLAVFPTFSASRFWSQVRSVGATHFAGFFMVAQALMARPPSPDDANTTLRIGMVAALPNHVKQEFEERFGVRLMETYGMTEAEPLTMTRLGESQPDNSVGAPTQDFEVAILDENDRPLPPGKIGNIAARPNAPSVMMLGYEDDDESTVAAFRNLWFHTRDLGWVDEEGVLYFSDRQNHAIRRRAENVSSVEVEKILLTHRDIEECVVLGVPSAMGEQDVKVVLVPKRGRRIDPAAVHEFCLQNMAKYMAPRYIDVLDKLPYTDMGKIDREPLYANRSETWDFEQGNTRGVRGSSTKP